MLAKPYLWVLHCFPDAVSATGMKGQNVSTHHSGRKKNSRPRDRHGKMTERLKQTSRHTEETNDHQEEVR